MGCCNIRKVGFSGLVQVHLCYHTKTVDFFFVCKCICYIQEKVFLSHQVSMSLRVVVVAAILTLVNCQCAFNSLGIFRGTTRYDGITIGTTSTVVTPSPASQIGCVVGGGLPVGTSCTFTAAGYIGSVIASCDATGWVYSPSNTLSPLNCPNYFSVGLSASGTHLVGERLSYTCSPGTYCSTDPCEAACDETTPGFFAVTPPLTCTSMSLYS